MDTPDKATATKVWRWNAGGFAYSSTGYDGDYGNAAITMDGAIVADFITAGVLRGIEILNGDGSFHVAVDGTVTASKLNVTGGRVNITSDDDQYVAVSAKSGKYYTTMSPDGIWTNGGFTGSGFSFGNLAGQITMEDFYLTAFHADKTLPQALRDIETRLTNGGL